MTTKAGDLELAIPKLPKGSFFPSILQPCRRIDQALYAVVMEAYVSGVSTRSVDALVESMGAASGISKSEVSRICAGLDERVTAFRNRTLGHTEFPYVYLDAISVHVGDDALGQVVSRAVVVATGVTAQGWPGGARRRRRRLRGRSMTELWAGEVAPTDLYRAIRPGAEIAHQRQCESLDIAAIVTGLERGVNVLLHADITSIAVQLSVSASPRAWSREPASWQGDDFRIPKLVGITETTRCARTGLTAQPTRWTN